MEVSGHFPFRDASRKEKYPPASMGSETGSEDPKVGLAIMKRTLELHALKQASSATDSCPLGIELCLGSQPDCVLPL